MRMLSAFILNICTEVPMTKCLAKQLGSATRVLLYDGKVRLHWEVTSNDGATPIIRYSILIQRHCYRFGRE